MTSKLVPVSRRSSHESIVKKAICLSDQLYTYPTSSTEAIDASAGPVVFTWDTSCTVSDTIDLTLYAPSLANHSVIKIIKNVNFSTGSYSLTLLPKWWDSTSEITLSLTISAADSPTFLSSIPAGPSFEVTYPASLISTAATGTNTGSTLAAAANTANPDAVVVDAAKKTGLNAGIVAVAVVVPILVILAGILFYVKRVRAKQAKKRERWSQHVDNRMSVISQHWQPGTSIGGRPSGQINRDSSHHVRGASTSTTFDGNMAGLGARAFGLDQSWQNQTYAGEQMSDEQHQQRPEMAEYSKSSQLFSTTQRPTSIASHAPAIETTRTSREPKLNGAASHGRAISMFDKPGRVSFAVEERTSRLSMGPGAATAAGHNRSSSVQSTANSVFSYIGNVLGGSPSNKKHNARAGGGRGGESISSLPSAVQRSSMFSAKNTPPRKSYYSTSEKEEEEEEKMEELEQGMTPVPEQGPWVLGDEEDEKRAAGSFKAASSPDDLLASYALRNTSGSGIGTTPSFEYDESEAGLGQVQVAERRDFGRPLAGSVSSQHQLRPGSIAGGNNPFRQSMISDAPSAYSGIMSEHNDHDVRNSSTRYSQPQK